MNVLVKHPWKGQVWVEASGQTEAIVRAAIQWGCAFLDIVEGAKCYVRREDKQEGPEGSG